MRKIVCIFVILSVALLTVPSRAKSHDPHITVTVKRNTFEDKLFFSGKLKPLNTVNITSPIEGVVVRKYFEYGSRLKQGALVAELDSKQLAKDFNQALTAYLTAKDHFMKSKGKLDGSKELYKLGIISKNEYINDQSEHSQNHVEFLKTKYALDEFIKYDDTLTSRSLEKLSLNDFKNIDKAFKEKRRTLKLHAPVNGVALMPETTESAKKIEVGSQLKLGDVILTVGDLTGLATELEVSEVDVVKIKEGQPVTITGVSFPGIVLNGSVISVDSQAIPSQGGVPTFMVKVEIPKLTEEARQRIKIGMSAKVALDVSRRGIMTLPIAAVYQKDHQPYVDVIKQGQVESRRIKTGQTLIRDVEILSGLNEHEIVQYQSKAFER